MTTLSPAPELDQPFLIRTWMVEKNFEDVAHVNTQRHGKSIEYDRIGRETVVTESTYNYGASEQGTGSRPIRH